MYNSMYYGGFNPYIMPQKTGLTKSILGGISKINWGNILNNTQKTLNVINQAIPVYYQVKPIYNNAKTMFKIIGTMNDNSKKSNNHNSNSNNINNEIKKDTGNTPIFFS